ncbi:MFS transporter [Kineosporia sp. J2-2]|uniref:MFS transporter n=1 Tax=Kineosporia corallincola TaxID=2835133 RepID=A0ABS5TQ49_9ACTN|nr:MDR family MFS transporter [Kineosporia corallincola]MBT0771729.1 MFS transporter [Kineosporia corallincola]
MSSGPDDPGPAGGTDQAPPALPRARMNVIFATIVLGMLLSALDQTIVSTALPTIVGDLGGAGHMSWVVTAYILAETIATVLTGKFGDLFGRKTVFQVSVVIFVVGSFFCGLADNMGMLIAARAVQGIGGGGIAVTATALIGDVIPLRERGRYQGALGAVFGVTTVIGPLLGGLFTDHLSWRWAFYVNVPLAIVVIAMAARAVPGIATAARPRVDYLGVLFIALGASGLTLATSWGGVEYAWGSATIVGLFAGSALALVVFVLVELRAEEPILPMRLFRSRVFSIASLLSFIVGFAMLGAITFLPTYLQYVQGASATMSGIRTLPMVLGLLVTALASGQAVSRTGRYRIFPIAGTAVTGVGLFLLASMDAGTPVAVQSLAMLVLGAGIGLSMQVLTIIVQNTVEYRDLGSATSGVTFFRTLGSSFGASVMGTIYANRLADSLPAALAEAGVPASAVATPSAVHQLPQATRTPIIQAYADTLHTMFLWSVPVAVVGFLVALVLPQVQLRGTAREAVRHTGEGFAMPADQTPDAQLETMIGQIVRHRPEAAVEVLARSRAGVDAPTAWALMGVHMREVALDQRTTPTDIEDHLGVPHGVLTTFYDGVINDGHLTRDGETLRLTASGSEIVTLLTQAWVTWIRDQLADEFGGADREDFEVRTREAVHRIARRVIVEQQRESHRV